MKFIFLRYFFLVLYLFSVGISAKAIHYCPEKNTYSCEKEITTCDEACPFKAKMQELQKQLPDECCIEQEVDKEQISLKVLDLPDKGYIILPYLLFYNDFSYFFTGIINSHNKPRTLSLPSLPPLDFQVKYSSWLI